VKTGRSVFAGKILLHELREGVEPFEQPRPSEPAHRHPLYQLGTEQEVRGLRALTEGKNPERVRNESRHSLAAIERLYRIAIRVGQGVDAAERDRLQRESL
jgi:hypothetical protein